MSSITYAGGAVLCAVIISAAIVYAGGAYARSRSRRARRREKSARPEAFKHLFIEEFPDFQSQITYIKAHKIIHGWESTVRSFEYLGSVSHQSEHIVYRYMTDKFCPIVSAEFMQAAQEDRRRFYEGLNDCVRISKTAAHSMVE